MSLQQSRKLHRPAEEAPRDGEITQCQVPFCTAEIMETVKRKVRICRQHRLALVIQMNGFQGRFCQQCSRVHCLSRFDGNKRGCRSRLLRRRQRIQSRGNKDCESWRGMPPSPSNGDSENRYAAPRSYDDEDDKMREGTSDDVATNFGGYSERTAGNAGPLVRLYRDLGLSPPPCSYDRELNSALRQRMHGDAGSSPPLGLYPFMVKQYTPAQYARSADLNAKNAKANPPPSLSAQDSDYIHCNLMSCAVSEMHQAPSNYPWAQRREFRRRFDGR